MAALLQHLRFFWLFLNSALAVLVFIFPIIFIGTFETGKHLTSRLMRLFARWIFWSSGLNIDIQGLKNIRDHDRYVIIANHINWVDSVALAAFLPLDLTWLAKKQLFRIPIFGWAMRAVGMVKVDRENKKKSKNAVFDAEAQLKKTKQSLVVYLEGTRSGNGRLRPLEKCKRGGAIIATRLKWPILVITVMNSWDIYPGKKLFNTGITMRLNSKSAIKIIIDKPIDPKGYTEEDRYDLTKRCWQIIAGNLPSDKIF